LTIQKIDLSGEWKFAIDSSDKGISEKWFDQTLKDKLILPGSMTSSGKGDDITLKTQWTGQIVDSAFYTNPQYKKYREPGNIKIPFWLQPVKHYIGAAWYQKEVTIPKDWNKKSIGLFIERCHWESRLWVDDQEVGMQNSLGTPHQYDLTKLLIPGKHRLTLCIDNRVKDIDPGVNSHSISDHTQTNWNGALGQLYLEARPMVKIQNIQVYPDVQNKKIAVKVKVQNLTGKATSAKLNLAVIENLQKESANFELKEGENTLEMSLEMGADAKLWNEFHPNVYSLEASVKDKASGQTDVSNTTFGMREFTTAGKQILINGQPTFLRGTLECAIFPKTGYPATEVTEWLRIFDICRAHGLNHMRFHSWCPPKAAFDAADQTGFYLQVEVSSWSRNLGESKPIDRYLYEESQRMIEAYGNHPSFCLMSYGNEPSGKEHVTYLTEFVNYWKRKDKRRIYTSGAGHHLVLPVSDYISSQRPRIQRWREGLKSIINAEPPRTDYDWSAFNSSCEQPVVSHEIGEWCVYPNFKEITKYDGVLKAKNFEIFQESLKEHGMEQLADSFLLASGKLQTLCYKADIEAALRTKGFGGFQLLDLHDFPGQGTALVGVLDAFWDEKGYVSPQEYKRFCNSTVPLVRLKKRIFTNQEQFEATAEVAHFGETPINGCIPEWKVNDKNGKIIQSGEFSKTDIPLGNGFQLGEISFPLALITNPEKLTLEVSVGSFLNRWDFWVYPANHEKIDREENIRVVQNLDDATRKYLADGGNVLLTLKKGTLPPEIGGDVQIGFSSILWNTAWSKKQAPHTLGILCNPKHPALSEFPTEYHSNWQWWDAMSHSQAINLSIFPTYMIPIIRVIDDWFTNRPLALIFEAKVGKGKVLISGIDLQNDLDKRVEAKQLLYSLKKYMTSEMFNPKTEIQLEKLNQLFKL